MEILFDFEVDEIVEQPKDKNNIVIVELKRFIKQRLNPLEDEIDNAQQPDELAIMFLSFADKGLEYRLFNIPKHLHDKIKEAVTPSDMDYFLDFIGRKIEESDKDSD